MEPESETPKPRKRSPRPSQFKLTAKHKQAIKLLAERLRPLDVAAQIGVTERTIFNWMLREDFKAQVAKAGEKHRLSLALETVDIEKLKAEAIASLHLAMAKGDTKAAIYVSEKTKAFEGQKSNAPQRFKVSFGQLPNDVVPEVVQLPSNVVQMKQENA